MTLEDIKDLADKGYTIPRISDKFNKSEKVIRRLIADHPEVADKLRANGKNRSFSQKRFGHYNEVLKI